jgi:hypothetical protein
MPTNGHQKAIQIVSRLHKATTTQKRRTYYQPACSRSTAKTSAERTKNTRADKRGTDLPYEWIVYKELINKSLTFIYQVCNALVGQPSPHICEDLYLSMHNRRFSVEHVTCFQQKVSNAAMSKCGGFQAHRSGLI